VASTLRWALALAVVAAVPLALVGLGAATGLVPTGDELGDAVQSGDADDVNATWVEQNLTRYTNAERRAAGRSAVAGDPALARVARGHSRDMARRGYYAHESPEGDLFVDRYREAGYDCRVRVNRSAVATGSENIAVTWAFERVTTHGAAEYHVTESEIARGLVRQWMASPDHRRNLLLPYWDDVGHGVVVTEVDGRTKVYATQNFC